ncbi:hypothetical protein AZE42_12409 [Rhizopogon vesiculosus]|uniref:Uncharacterized protein n=1 Tax=Rhizopogon vesiculosus TaxID=180088 RepID=A0A1J8Q1D7_9AGAM|nr:hypothetical protein AZE42_12409 [Rhizopogon vesiculosus]
MRLSNLPTFHSPTRPTKTPWHVTIFTDEDQITARVYCGPDIRLYSSQSSFNHLRTTSASTCDKNFSSPSPQCHPILYHTPGLTPKQSCDRRRVPELHSLRTVNNERRS